MLLQANDNESLHFCIFVEKCHERRTQHKFVITR